ncbi:MAG: hypothetical protein AABM30_05110 [Actinomycetota bacterium]
MAGDRLTGRPPAPPARSVATLLSVPAVASTLVAAGLVLLSVVVRIIVSHRMPAPWIMSDELIYSDLAESFHEHHEMLFRDHARPFQSIYPVLISPAWLADSVPSAYSIVKGLNAILMSLAAIPFYLWARRLVPPAHAIGALILFLLLPAFVYTDEVMTENAAFPAILLALLAMAGALERPTPVRQVLAIAAIGLACAARLQAFVLVIGFPTAIVLKGLLDARAVSADRTGAFVVRSLRRYVWALGLIVFGAFAYVAVKVGQGAGVSGILGAYQGTEAGYSAAPVARWFVFHIAELPFTVALVPVSAFIVIFGLALRRAAVTTEAERAFLAVAVATSLWMVLQVAAFASQFSQRIEERNLIYLMPLFLLSLMVWTARGLPRPPVLAGTAALLPAVLLVSLPLENLLNVSIKSDTFSLVPLLRLASVLNGGTYDMRILLMLGAAAAALAFLWLPARFGAYVLPAGVGVFLALTSYSVFGSARFQAVAARAAPGVADANWIDDRVGTDAKVVFVNDQGLDGDPHSLWQTEFWNRSVHPVLNLSVPQDVLGRTATLDSGTGRITAVEPDVARDARTAEYAVAPATLELAGRVLARPGRLVLYRLEQPLRLARVTSGIYADGWTADRASLTQFATPGADPALLVIRLRRPSIGVPLDPARVTITIAGAAPTTLVVREKTKVVTIPVPRPPFHVDLGVTPTFSPADLGLSADGRQLGVLVSFEVVRR